MTITIEAIIKEDLLPTISSLGYKVLLLRNQKRKGQIKLKWFAENSRFHPRSYQFVEELHSTHGSGCWCWYKTHPLLVQWFLRGRRSRSRGLWGSAVKIKEKKIMWGGIGYDWEAAKDGRELRLEKWDNGSQVRGDERSSGNKETMNLRVRWEEGRVRLVAFYNKWVGSGQVRFINPKLTTQPNPKLNI